MNTNRISVRIGNIRYGDASLTVAIAVNDAKRLFLTFPTVESILNYRADQTREKIASKSLESALGMGSKPVKTYQGTVNNKTGGYSKIGGRRGVVNLIEFEDFVKVVAWEASVNQNPIAFQLLVAGFADSFRSLAYEQMGVKLRTDERNETIAEYLGCYHSLFDWIRDTHLRLHGHKPDGRYYSAINVAINIHLFGKSNFKDDRLNNASTAELRMIETVQIFLLRQANRNRDLDPLELVKAELPRF
jgi:hypothetical protein